jgi:hypothetical protein
MHALARSAACRAGHQFRRPGRWCSRCRLSFKSSFQRVQLTSREVFWEIAKHGPRHARATHGRVLHLRRSGMLVARARRTHANEALRVTTYSSEKSQVRLRHSKRITGRVT